MLHLYGVPVFGPCFDMQYLVSFLVLKSSSCGRESCLLYFNCHVGAMWLLVLVFCVSSSRCYGLVQLRSSHYAVAHVRNKNGDIPARPPN